MYLYSSAALSHAFLFLYHPFLVLVLVCVLVAQSCLTLCDAMDCGPPGSSVHGILQARILEYVAISFSRGCSQFRHQTGVSCIAGACITSEPPGKPLILVENTLIHNLLFGYLEKEELDLGLSEVS